MVNHTYDDGDNHTEESPRRVKAAYAEGVKSVLNPRRSIVIPIPPEVEPYAEDIRRFVNAMVYKLKVHHKKGKWENLPIAEAHRLLYKEVVELKEAMDGGNLIEILTESADVANFALIIASIATERGE